MFIILSGEVYLKKRSCLDQLEIKDQASEVKNKLKVMN